MRLNEVLNILKEHLEPEFDTDEVEIANIGRDNQSQERVVITLMKIEEETTLKNGRYAKVNENFKTVFKNRPVYTNLFLLFSCTHGDYDTALNQLSKVVEFFQGKNTFTHLDGYDAQTNEKFKIILELLELSFEQINYIWSFLGGKKLPSVMYKARLLPLEAKDKKFGEGEPILQVNLEGSGAF